MEAVLTHLQNAHQEAKNVAIAAIQADGDVEQALAAIKAIYALIQSVTAGTQANG